MTPAHPLDLTSHQNLCPTTFHQAVLDWFYQHGRHTLPWQRLVPPFDPYTVWISEIMLQQTQVATVIDYFNRFMARFPTLSSLATAPVDDVLALWAGLGYYARARNLHKAAIQLHHIYQATHDYPQTLEQWQALSGIGRSTAGAIMAMGLGKFGVICDGNVKRVLTRHFGIGDDITKSSTDKRLWELATYLTPPNQSGHYAQAMMDLGATLCTRTRPNCTICPIRTTCHAYQHDLPQNYPVKTKKTDKPSRYAHVYLIQNNHQSLWLKRPDDGIWGGLWCLPLIDTDSNHHQDKLTYLLKSILNTQVDTAPVASLRHTLTHFHWQLSLVVLLIDDATATALTQALGDDFVFTWHDTSHYRTLAHPKAMDKLLKIYHNTDKPMI